MSMHSSLPREEGPERLGTLQRMLSLQGVDNCPVQKAGSSQQRWTLSPVQRCKCQ